MAEIRLLNASEIECRVGQCGKSRKGQAWCSLLLYKDARCDQRILDETFGMFNWQRRHETINGQLCCTVSIKNPETNEWVDKQDVGTESNTEATKGLYSDSFKRACFNWGVGRELYTAPKIFLLLNNEEVVENNGKVKLAPKVVFTVTEIDYDDARNIKALVIVDQNGVVRFKMGEKVQEPKEEPENPDEPTFEEQMTAYILPALEQCQSEGEVKRIWDDYSGYQKRNEFIKAINNRLSKIRKVA